MKRLKIEQEIDKTISCKENKRVLFFNCNSRIFCKIHLDNKANNQILNNFPRCDYIIVSKDLEDIALFIELKGSNTVHALEQIEQSINTFGNAINKKYAAIVCSKIHPKFNTHKQQFIKRNKTQLFIKENQMQLKYNSNKQSIEKYKY
ncbi:MAG: hypothetical protein IJ566_04650 [Cardiobacteriaceae bacterium]|nr:hypothetical protein [Cardiobacteriaceae bacterium]